MSDYEKILAAWKSTADVIEAEYNDCLAAIAEARRAEAAARQAAAVHLTRKIRIEERRTAHGRNKPQPSTGREAWKDDPDAVRRVYGEYPRYYQAEAERNR